MSGKSNEKKHPYPCEMWMSDKTPSSPDTLVGALQDRVRPASRPIISRKPIKPIMVGSRVYAAVVQLKHQTVTIGVFTARERAEQEIQRVLEMVDRSLCANMVDSWIEDFRLDQPCDLGRSRPEASISREDTLQVFEDAERAAERKKW